MEQVSWAPVHAIDLEKNQLRDMPLRESYLLQTLPRAIKTVRELELAEVTNNVFTKYKNIGEKMDENPYAFSAHTNHQRVLLKAKYLSEKLEELKSEYDSNTLSGPTF